MNIAEEQGSVSYTEIRCCRQPPDHMSVQQAPSTVSQRTESEVEEEEHRGAGCIRCHLHHAVNIRHILQGARGFGGRQLAVGSWQLAAGSWRLRVTGESRTVSSEQLSLTGNRWQASGRCADSGEWLAVSGCWLVASVNALCWCKLLLVHWHGCMRFLLNTQ